MRIEDLIEELENIMENVGPGAQVRLNIENDDVDLYSDIDNVDYNVDSMRVYLQGRES